MDLRDLDAHRSTEPAAPQLELDGLEQVVRLVGDLEVGIARDAKAAHSVISIFGKSDSECPITCSSARRVPVRNRQEAREQFWHFHACKTLLTAFRVADEEPQAQ